MIFVWLLFFTYCRNATKNNQTSSESKLDSKQDSTYIWTKLLDRGDWKKSYNFQMFTVHDTLWIFHSEGNWYSVDGKNWTKSKLTNSISNLAFLDYIYFNGSMYGLGNFKGNIQQYTFKPEIYRTTDFKNWTILSNSSNLPHRFFYHPFAFNHAIWIVGGEDKKTKYSDIWRSADGIHWIKLKENLPFGKRSGSQIVNLNDTLYLLDHDVWRSANGLDWQLVTNEIVKGEQIFGYSAQVFDHKIWLLGCNRNGRFSSQVLMSEDGKKWYSQAAPWLPRGGIAATVRDNKIYMTGGKYGGTPDHPDFRYDNDLWMLEKIGNSKN